MNRAQQEYLKEYRRAYPRSSMTDAAILDEKNYVEEYRRAYPGSKMNTGDILFERNQIRRAIALIS